MMSTGKFPRLNFIDFVYNNFFRANSSNRTNIDKLIEMSEPATVKNSKIVGYHLNLIKISSNEFPSQILFPKCNSF